MDDAKGVGVCCLGFVMLYLGVVFTAITEHNILDITYAIFLSIYFVRIYIYKRKNKNSLQKK